MHDERLHTDPPEIQVLRLTLPVPPSPNNWPSHPMQHHREKSAYKRTVWWAACEQSPPMAHPPERVVMFAHFFLHALRDEDNLKGSLKWLVDALKQKQTGEVRWRDGIADTKGYYVDDSPDRLTILEPVQEIDRKHQRVEVTLRWKAHEQSEAA